MLNMLLVDLATLSVQQLSSVKKQLDDELEHLSTSFSKLRVAQTKFRECIKSIQEGVASYASGIWPEKVDSERGTSHTDILADRPVLVPLTASLYVPGRLADSDSVIVDVGTGFYIGKVDSEPLHMVTVMLIQTHRAQRMP